MLSEDEQTKLLSSLATELGCTVEEAQVRLAYTWEGWWARPSQHEPSGEWLYWLLKAGRGFGKTRIGAEWTRKQAQNVPIIHLIAPTAADYRDVMINGESGILAVSPRHERPTFYSSRRQLVWPNGSIALCFSGEDPESLRGPQCYKLWADEIAAWQYPQETWDMAMFGLRLGDLPQACITSTPKPIGVYRELVKDPDCVVTGGPTYENLGNLGPTYRRIIRRYEGTNLGRQELDAELLEDEGLAYKFSERIHVIEAFDIPDHWDKFASFDYGWTNPSALIYWAVDERGNCVIYDMVYEPGWPSELVPAFRERNCPGTVWADPSTWNKPSVTRKWNEPKSAADEFEQLGFPIQRANNDRRAGFLRLSELFRRDPLHKFPDYHGLHGQTGSPRLFVFNTPATEPLREQIIDAPLEDFEPGMNQGPFPGEAVAVKWEGRKGHAHAALRYGAMTRPSPSDEPPQEGELTREEMQQELLERRERELDERFESRREVVQWR